MEALATFKLGAAAGTFVMVALRATAAAAGSASEEADQFDRPQLAQTAPEGFKLSEQAEAAQRAGRFQEAFALYNKAQLAAPASVVPIRGACRAALALGQAREARPACNRASALGGTPEDQRNVV